MPPPPPAYRSTKGPTPCCTHRPVVPACGCPSPCCPYSSGLHSCCFDSPVMTSLRPPIATMSPANAALMSSLRAQHSNTHDSTLSHYKDCLTVQHASVQCASDYFHLTLLLARTRLWPAHPLCQPIDGMHQVITTLTGAEVWLRYQEVTKHQAGITMRLSCHPLLPTCVRLLIICLLPTCCWRA